jgi:hypothetical protein
MARATKFYFLIVLISLAFHNIYCQTPFTKGYYVVNGDTLQGYVEERESYLSEIVQFKKELNSEPSSVKIENVSTIYLFEFDQLYVKRVVEVDKKPLETHHLEETITKKLVTETAFLRYLVKGSVDLLRYKDSDFRVHFFYQKDQEIKELSIVKYKRNGQLAQFDEYKQQLKNLFSDCPKINAKGFSLTEKSLITIFKDYNMCISNQVYSTETKKTGSKKTFEIFAGLANQNLSRYGGDNAGSLTNESKYTTVSNFMLGFTFNLQRRKIKPTTYGIELIWKSNAAFKADALEPVSANPATIRFDLSYVNLLFIYKYTFKRNSRFSPYLKIGGGASYLVTPNNNTARHLGFFGKSTVVDPFVDLRSLGFTIEGGVGFSINRFSLEARTDFTFHGASNRGAAIDVSSIGLTGGFILNKLAVTH